MQEQILKFSQKEFNTKLGEIWQKLIYEQRPVRKENPKAIVFGGQPGAGKSSIMMDMKELMLDNNCIIISGDEYRKDHPQFKKIVEHYGDEWSLKTGKWSGMLVEKIIEKAIKENFNIQVEGTLRDVGIPKRTMEQLKANNYDITLMIVTCNQKLSWQSTIQRYERDKIFGEIPRAVDEKYYKTLIEDLPQNAENLYNIKLHDRFIVWSRDEHYNRNRVYDSTINGKFSKEIIERELEPKQNTEEKSKESLRR